MLFRCLGENYHIIQIDEAIGEVQFTKAVLHEPLESRRGITQPERHTFTLIQTHTAQSKGSILLRFHVHRNLPKPRIEIKSGVMDCSSQTLQSLTNARQRVRVLYGQSIEPSEVNAEME